MIDSYCALCGKKDWECICDPQGGALIDAIKNQAEQMRKLTDSIDRLGDLISERGRVK